MWFTEKNCVIIVVKLKVMRTKYLHVTAVVNSEVKIRARILKDSKNPLRELLI